MKMTKQDKLIASTCVDNAEKLLTTIPEFSKLNEDSKNICRVVASVWLLKLFCNFCKKG